MKYYLTGKHAQAIDKYTQETLGVPGLKLMESAAGKLAESVDDAVKNASEYALKYPCYGKLEGFDKSQDKILSLVESGNNGGDAVAAAWMLKDMGYDTYIYEIGGISRKTESYLSEVEKAKSHGVKFVELINDKNDNKPVKDEEVTSESYNLSDFRVIIDGIFGVGLTREVTGVQKASVDAVNRLNYSSDSSGIDTETRKNAFVVGVDIPSGISADNGHVLGTAVRCDMTVTFEYIKYGMLINEGREYSGDIRCESIGLFVPADMDGMDSVFEKKQIRTLSDPSDPDKTRRDNESLYINYEYDEAEIKRLLPERKQNSNKGTYGKVLIIAGSKDIYGAVYMAAEAAYRTGAGLVKVVTDIRNRDVLCDKLPEAMMLTYDSEKLKFSLRKSSLVSKEGFFNDYRAAIKWADVILAGPGLGTGIVSKDLLRILAESLSDGQKLILDADALNIISSGKPSDWFKRFSSGIGDGDIVITPHMMEMARLVKANYNEAVYDFMMKGLGLESDIAFIKAYGKHQAYSLSNSYGIITVLKDARTLITCPGRMAVYINTTGNSGMSKGGSGDVLAGMIAGILAQSKVSNASVMDSVSAAVHLHGRAGDIAKEKQGERSMMARDIIDAIPDAFKI